MNAAWDFGTGFAERLPALERRDESHLVQLAMECMNQAPFGRWNQTFRKTLLPDVEYAAIPKKPRSSNYVVGKRMTFTRFRDFLVADFFEGLHVGHYPQRCENCGRYYLKTNARFQKYCTYTDPNDPLKRSCQAVAAARGREAKESKAARHFAVAGLFFAPTFSSRSPGTLFSPAPCLPPAPRPDTGRAALR